MIERNSSDETEVRQQGVTDGLVAQAQQDQKDGFSELYSRLAPALFAWIVLKLRGNHRGRIDPEDLVQEAWWQALRSFKDFDAKRGSFRQWVFGIATHVLLNALRNLRSRHLAHGSHSWPSGNDVPDEATAVSRRVANDDTLQELIEAVRTLTPEESSLFMHCGLEGLTATRAAEIMRLSPDAVAKRWQRLRQKLRGLVHDAGLIAQQSR